jgi:putative ABC transport system ATP-binding protein
VTSPILSARGLTKVYGEGPTAVRALDGVDVDLLPGEIVILLGPSGSGKSTLLHLLGGLDTPTAGTLRFADHTLSGAGDDALTRYRRDHVGFVFQFYNLIPSLSALENVALVTDIARKPMRPADALAMVGLERRAAHFPSELSGGEQQRVSIARAIAKNPDLLLCDEPTGALDGATGRLVLEAIVEVNRRLSTAVAIITHNVVIAEMGDRVLTLGDGRIASTTSNPTRRPPRELSW